MMLVACGTSHAPGTDGSTGSCPGTPPGPCAVPGPEIGCCERVDARCVDGVWDCPDPSSMGWACETYSCGTTMTCSGPEPRCRANLGGGCCGEAFAAVCGGGLWSCGFGGVEESFCTAFAPMCGSTSVCEGLGWVECLGASGCTAVYDDACCPICSPGGPCADCYHPVFHHCAGEGEACADDPPAGCGFPAPWICPPEVPSCATATPLDDTDCDVAGCIVRVGASCTSGGCPVECVPVHRQICNATCMLMPPDCGARVPEAQGGCYTGYCISASVCAR